MQTKLMMSHHKGSYFKRLHLQKNGFVSKSSQLGRSYFKVGLDFLIAFVRGTSVSIFGRPAVAEAQECFFSWANKSFGLSRPSCCVPEHLTGERAIACFWWVQDHRHGSAKEEVRRQQQVLTGSPWTHLRCPRGWAAAGRQAGRHGFRQ